MHYLGPVQQIVKFLIKLLYCTKLKIFVMSLISVIKQMNQHYHMCVTVSRQLQQRLGSSVQSALSPQIVIATADKLIYNYAIEMVSYLLF